MTISNYDKIADALMSASGTHVTLKFDDVQGLLRELRERQFALEATLLFHVSRPWDKEKSSKWFQFTKSYEATTKVLCDHIRKVLDKHVEPDVSESPTGRLNVEPKGYAQRVTKHPNVPGKLWPPLPQDTKVRTTKRRHASDAEERRDLTALGIAARRWGVPGTITYWHDSHGLSYVVMHEDGTTGLYATEEFEVVPEPKPGWTIQDTIREVQRVQDRREEVRRKLDAGEITREEARREFPESY
jgi:hypothetical protein